MTGKADPEQLRLLRDEHAPALLAFARRSTGDHHTAEDVVQEVFVRAWRHPEAFDASRGSVKAWLFTVTRNVIIDLHRREGTRPSEILGDDLPPIATDDAIENVVQAWYVEEAMRRLSDDHRAVLQQVFVRELSVADAAKVLGVPPGTVKSRTYYALRSLRLALAEMGIGDTAP